MKVEPTVISVELQILGIFIGLWLYGGFADGKTGGSQRSSQRLKIGWMTSTAQCKFKS